MGMGVTYPNGVTRQASPLREHLTGQGDCAMRVRVYTVKETAALFEPGGALYGFCRSEITPELISSERAERLVSELNGEQPILGILRDGRLAALDLATFRRYAIEERGE